MTTEEARNARPARHGLPRRERFRRAAVGTGIVLVAAPLIIAFVYGRAIADRHLVAALSDVNHGAPMRMAAAGWATAAFVPLAALIVKVSAYQAETNRQRAVAGHAIARPAGFWIRRIPVAVTIAVAVTFVPLRHDPLQAGWNHVAGGPAFAHAWMISVLTAAVGLLIVQLEDVRMTIDLAKGRAPRSRRWSPWAAYVLPIVSLALALLVA